MTNWTWTDWDGTVNAAPDGIVVNRGSHGLNVSAQDAARYGHLFLNDGRWNDEQIISAEWVHQATSAQVDVTLPLNPLNRADVVMGINAGPGIYGDGWWTNGKNPEGNRVLPGVPPETFFAYGIDNNFIFVVPEWDMVVVREATNEGDSSVSNNVWATFLNLVGDAIMDVPGGDSVHGADDFTRLPYAAYRTRDSDGDGNGDRVDNLLGKSAGVFKTNVGELDLAAGTSQYRVVAKFALPDVSKSGPALQLEDATLRWHLESVVGMPAEPVSVFHSVTDNDTDALASDHEDTSYTDTRRDLVQPSDLAQQYYETDVTAFVQSDYDADGSDALSAFRLELVDHAVIADRQSQGYEFTIAGNRAHYPELVLTFGYVGDLNHDGTLDVTDIDLLTATILGGEMNLKFDLDKNGTVDGADRTIWVHDLRRTWFGDANLDGQFDSGDLVEVFYSRQIRRQRRPQCNVAYRRLGRRWRFRHRGLGRRV